MSGNVWVRIVVKIAFRKLLELVLKDVLVMDQDLYLTLNWYITHLRHWGKFYY